VSPKANAEAAALTASKAAACLSLDALVMAAQACIACTELAQGRHSVVVGQHPAGARVLVVGEAPGAQEDVSGEPFVGRSGQLLDEVLAECGLPRSGVAVASVVKCRPPGNRTPKTPEIAACSPWLDRQVQLVDPLVVVAMGGVAAQWALGKGTKIGEARGRVRAWRDRHLMVTFHPSAALRFGPNGAPLAAMREDFTTVREFVAQASSKRA
jgi:uracil-DNA glycosylase family 4